MYGKDIGKPDAFRRKPIQIRRDGIPITIATQVRANIFCSDKQDVRTVSQDVFLLFCLGPTSYWKILYVPTGSLGCQGLGAQAAMRRRMQEAEVPQGKRWDYLKWLRYYLDFCVKYRHQPRDREKGYDGGVHAGGADAEVEERFPGVYLAMVLSSQEPDPGAGTGRAPPIFQQLMGHSDVRTTMIYTHTVQSRTIKEAESPLDFGVPA
jgi:hypothetical protein